MRHVVRAADWLKRVVFPTSRIISGIGAAAMVGMVLITVTNVIARRAFHAPISGAIELVLLMFMIVSFLMLAHCAAQDGHIVVTLLTQRLPKRVRAINAVIMHIITIGTLSMASWQLWVFAMRVQDMGQTGALVRIDIYPIVYMAALAFMLLTIVYLIKFLYSLDEVRKSWS